MGEVGGAPGSGGGGFARRARRRRIAGAAALAIAFVAGLLWHASLRARDGEPPPAPRVRGSVALPGLEEPVLVDRDRLGIPHVEARSRSDAFFALGYVHAQDRLEQLLDLRRRARGSAAEVEGVAAVEGDRVARLIGFAELAARQLERLERPTRRALAAYAAGVNARIGRLEVGGEGAAATEAWRPEDSLAVFKLFAWSLSESVQASLVLNELVVALGAQEADRFFPPRTAGRPPGERATAALPDWLGRGVAALRHATGLAGFGVGSTAFAVRGRDTASGHPVLVADSHFEPTAPAALYLAHLRDPELDVAGATLPGVPVFWWGRNPELAWAAVNAGVVVTDLYSEVLRRGGSEVHDGQRWRSVDERVEQIGVRNGRDETLVVRRTSHGPLLPGDEEGEAVSVAWTGARIDGPSGIGSLLDVARARDAGDVQAALRRHREPPIALVWVEASGGGGLQVAGWIPHRTLASELLPLPGRARWYAWSEAVPFEALPALRLGERTPFAIAADQLYEGALPEEPIDGVWRSGARRRRLATLLSEVVREAPDLRRLAALSSDVGLDRSRELAALALELAGDAPVAREARELSDLLRAWDGRATPESVGATAYHTYLDVLADSLFAERVGPERWERYLALESVDLEALVLGVLRDAARGEAADGWAEPARVGRLASEGLRATWLALSYRHGADPRRWSWGSVHALRFRARRGSPAGLGPFPYGGAPHAVLAGAYSLPGASEGDFGVRVAATGRFAVDAEALDLALVSLAPGQSERVDDPHFADGIEPWRVGRHALLATRRIEVEDRSVARLVLEPLR